MNKNWIIVNLNNKNFLKVGNQVFECQIGERGLNKAIKKNEGDKTTPKGLWNLETVFYRPDKLFRPKFKKKMLLKYKKFQKAVGGVMISEVTTIINT